ncbi:MAG TPA: phage head closure protein [Rhodocyclaceae bacterium]
MRAGQLRDRITIQQRTVTRGSMGAPVDTWTDVATVWAQFDPLRGREFFSAKQEQTENSVRFWIRYRAGIETKMRIVFAGKHYDIEAVIDARGRRQMLEIMTREGLTNG